MHATWSDIELDPDIKSRITWLVSLLDPTSRQSRLLKRGRTSGALLYGPPGTGKTHLARVLAKDSTSSAVMLHISAAEIESKWVGETEKTIKALFRLGKMLFPSIIFIDEADSLFSRRELCDRNWETSRVNQLLGEVDGIAKDASTPFLLLSTNHPGKLDHAVLRRVPGRFYVGLPSSQGRENIFRICLKDEDNLCPNLDFGALAASTAGYTGSDIEFVCKEATMVWADEVMSGQTETPHGPPLSMPHFQKALERSSPTVSNMAIGELRRFAEQFDKPALRLLNQSSESHATSTRLSPSAASISWRPDTHSTTNSRLINCERSTECAQDTDANQQHEAKVTTVARCRVKDYEPVRRPAPVQPSASLPIPPPNSSSAEASQPPHPVVPVLQSTIPPTPAASSIYQPLDKAGPEIRLMEVIEDGSSGGKIQCRLHTVSLAAKPVYTALSYVWGDATLREQVSVNGESVSVTASLADALRWVKWQWQKSFPRRPASEFRLWADALCIDQDKGAVHERNHQVKLMRDIYSGAELTLAAVATTDSVVCHALDIYNQIFDVITNIKMIDIATYNWLRKVPSLWSLAADESQYCRNKSWDALAKFNEQPYWFRVWIMQEVALSRNLKLFCGNRSIEFDQLLRIASILETTHTAADGHSRRDGKIPDFVSNEAWCDPCYENLITRPMWRMEAVLKGERERRSALRTGIPLRLQLIFNLEATDPRDHIYGLLGMFDLDVEIDYQKTVERVFQDFIEATLRVPFVWRFSCGQDHELGSLSFLQYSGLGSGNLADASPSWLPDFSAPLPPWHMRDICAHWTIPFGRLSGPEHEPEVRGSLLTAYGVQVLKIAKAEMPTSGPPDEVASQQTRLKFLDLVRDITLGKVLGNEHNGPKMPPLQAIFRAFATLKGRSDARVITQAFDFFITWQQDMARGKQDGALYKMLDPNFKVELDPASFSEVVDWFLPRFFPGQEYLADRQALEKAWHQLPSGVLEARQSLPNWGRSLFKAEEGYIGLGFEQIREGDLVCLIKGCQGHIILRRVDDHYLNMGPCFVSGLSTEECEKWCDDGKAKPKRFDIW